jgi:outer membrane immunogenic protein
MRAFFLVPCLALGCVVGLDGEGFAADLLPRPEPVYTKAPPKPAAYSWTGVYAGAHVGGAWGNQTWLEDFSGSAGFGGPLHQDASYTASGVIGGGQIGFNYQVGWAVAGVEADFSGADIRGDAGPVPAVRGAGGCISTATTGEPQTCSTKVDWMSTVTGRFGTALDRTLLYVKGGGAWEHEQLDNVCPTAPCQFSTNTSTGLRVGLTVGAGAEYAFDPHWSAKLEYDYIQFGTRDVTFLNNVSAALDETEYQRQNFHVVKLGVNYKFDSINPTWR